MPFLKNVDTWTCLPARLHCGVDVIIAVYPCRRRGKDNRAKQRVVDASEKWRQSIDGRTERTNLRSPNHDLYLFIN